jgi:hypothetical protein
VELEAGMFRFGGAFGVARNSVDDMATLDYTGKMIEKRRKTVTNMYDICALRSISISVMGSLARPDVTGAGHMPEKGRRTNSWRSSSSSGSQLCYYA